MVSLSGSFTVHCWIWMNGMIEVFVESFGSVRSRWWPEIKSACPDVPVLLVALQKELRNHPKTLKALKAKMQRPITYNIPHIFIDFC
jgi:GTPase SAR1 family protein